MPIRLAPKNAVNGAQPAAREVVRPRLMIATQTIGATKGNLGVNQISMVHSNDIRADYIIDGYSCLGVVALMRAPIAFLSYEDRAHLMGCDDYSFCDQLPMPLTLAQTATLLAGYEGH